MSVTLGPWHESTEPPPQGEPAECFARGLADGNFDDVAEVSFASESTFRLIAAAPTMYEALEKIANLPVGTGLLFARDIALVALAQARGES